MNGKKIKKIEYEDNILVIEFDSGEKITARGHLTVDVIKDNLVIESILDNDVIFRKTKNNIVTTIQLQCIEQEEHVGFFYVEKKYMDGRYCPTGPLIHKRYKCQ